MEPLIDFAKETIKARKECSSSLDQTSSASPLKLTLKLPKPTSKLDILISNSPSNLRASGSPLSNSRYNDYQSQSTASTRANRYENASQIMIRSQSQVRAMSEANKDLIKKAAANQ